MSTPSANEHHDSVIGKSIVIKGQIVASVPLFVHGQVEGSITALEQRVTVGKEGTAKADISAGEVVILGDVCGNLNGCSLVDIRSEGSFTGGLSTDRLSIQDGAVVNGTIESHVPGENNKRETNPALQPLAHSLSSESSHREAWQNLAVPEPA